jgi:hypothetical protein
MRKEEVFKIFKEQRRKPIPNSEEIIRQISQNLGWFLQIDSMTADNLRSGS